MPIKIGLSNIRKEKLEGELKRILPKLVSIGVEKVILFGSLARDDIHQGSDIDLIIIKKTDKKFLERLDEFYEKLNPTVALDIFVYTPEEFQKMKDITPFIKRALLEGKVIYEKR